MAHSLPKHVRERLTALFDEVNRAKYPNTPKKYLGRHNLRCTSANDLQRLIIDFLRGNHHQAERVNTMGTPIIGEVYVKTVGGALMRQKGVVGWRKTTATLGSADVHATILGRSVKIEVKWGDDRLSGNQMAYAEEVRKAGGVYVVAPTLEDFLTWYDNFMAYAAS